ncbi:MAG: TIM-barrel domain-containing protein, partial [bacterium]
MKYLKVLGFLVSFLFGVSEICRAAQLGEVTSIEKTPHGVILTGNMTDGASAELSITFYSETIVRVRLGINRVLDKKSLLLEAVRPVEIPFKVEESAATITIESGDIRIEMQKNSARIAFSTLEGEVLLSEYNEKGMELLDGEVAAYFNLHADDHFFGFGEKFGGLDKVGTTVVCYNKDAGDSYGDDTYINIPFYMNPKGYGIFFHTTWRTVYDLGSSSSDWFSMRADGGDLDYFFIYGPELKNVLASYTYLTGCSTMPPKWALGLWHGTYTGGHKGKAGFGQEEFLEIARTFRKKKIPCDVLRIDSNWDDLDGADYIWHKSYPEPVAMIEEVKAM